MTDTTHAGCDSDGDRMVDASPQVDVAYGLTEQVRHKIQDARFPLQVSGHNFQNHDFSNVSGKGAKFLDCDFRYSTFTGAYFREAHFTNCDFTGSRFKDCNFRDAVFVGCKFHYSQFSSTVIHRAEVLSSLPPELNIRRELLMTHRKNAESIGDVEAVKVYIREELKASRRFYQEAWRHQGAYYRRKYPGLWSRSKMFLRACGHWLDWHFWGHGEFPGKLATFMVFALFFVAALSLVVDASVSVRVTPVRDYVAEYANCLLATVCTFLGVSPDAVLPSLPLWLRIPVVLFRYFALGFFTSSLFRRMSRR